MGKKKKGWKKVQAEMYKQGSNPNTYNFSGVQGMAPQQYWGMAVHPYDIVAAQQFSRGQYIQMPGTNIYVPEGGVPPPVAFNRGPVVNTNVNRRPAQTQPKVAAKKKQQPTASNVQKPGTNVGTKQPPAQSQGNAIPKKKKNKPKKKQPGANTNVVQSPAQSKSNVTPANKVQPTGTNVQRPGTNVNKQQPAQAKSNVTPKNKMQPSVSNIQKPGTNVNNKKQPAQSKGNVTPKNKQQPAGSNIQRPATNVNNKQQPAQPKSNVTPKNKVQPAVSNIQKPGTNVNNKQQPAQSNSNVTPKNKIKLTLINTQKPATNVNNNQQAAQSNSKATPQNQAQPTGGNIQQPASMSALTPGKTSLQSQDSSGAVASTSGGSASAADPKQVDEVDLTDDIIEVPVVKPPIEVVDLTEDDTEVATASVKVGQMIEVDSKSAARLLAEQPNLLSDAPPDLWHKVIVQVKSAAVNRVPILNAINKRIAPQKIVPYFFQMEDGHITFLVHNCSDALAALFKCDLKVPFWFSELELKIQLNAKKVNFSDILQRSVSKRLFSDRTYLDLSKLTSIPGIREVLYDLSVTSHLELELLKTAQVMAPYILSLRLAGNGLSTLQHLAPVFKTKWTSLKILDVSDNKIKAVSELAIFKPFRIEELYLHRNPVCGMLQEDYYISAIRQNFPHLVKLDGTYLNHVVGLPRWRPNYINFGDRSESAELADQFVEHFFTLYDRDDRTWLWDLYHDDACFSVSSTYSAGQTTTRCARLSPYTATCRNLLHPSSKLRSKATLCQGAEQVLARFDKLPRTRHDPYSFTVDLLRHTDKSAILTVTGVYRERNQLLEVSPRHFMRTFVLVRLEDNEYQIVNDIMYVTNASTGQAEDAFTFTKPHTPPKKTNPPKQVTETEKNAMVGRYSQLTGMTTDWSRKCLNSARWSLKRALETFVRLYEAKKIPADRFMKNQKKA